MKTKTQKDKQMMKVILSQEAVLCQIKFTLSAVNRLTLFELWWKSYIDIECCQGHHFKSGSSFKSHIDSLYSEHMHQLLWLLAWVLDKCLFLFLRIFVFFTRGQPQGSVNCCSAKAYLITSTNSLTFSKNWGLQRR